MQLCSMDRATDVPLPQADPPVERKARKSVAFSDGATIVDGDGNVTSSAEVNGRKNSAESHTAGMSFISERGKMRPLREFGLG
jgi:hypothetical protein